MKILISSHYLLALTEHTSSHSVNKDGLIETVGSGEPRIDYKDDSKGALLLEPSRSNSLVQSNQFDTTWTINASALDLTSGQSGVYGSNDAWLLKKNYTGSRFLQQSVSLSSAQYSYSVYLKAESTNWVLIWSYDGSTGVEAYFDLENGVVGDTGGSNLDSTNIESVGNGWYRCTLTYTRPTTLVRIYPADDNGSVSPTDDNGIYIQNAQLEQGSYATSYIPTQGGAVTRVAETCNGSGNSQIFNDSEGVLMMEINTSDTSSVPVISLSNGTLSNEIEFAYYGTNQFNFILRVSGGTPNVIGTVNASDFNKFAVSYTTTDFKVYLNGVLIGSNTLPSPLSGLNTLDFYLPGVSNHFYGNVKQIQYFNTALTDQELINLTTI